MLTLVLIALWQTANSGSDYDALWENEEYYNDYSDLSYDNYEYEIENQKYNYYNDYSEKSFDYDETDDDSDLICQVYDLFRAQDDIDDEGSDLYDYYQTYLDDMEDEEGDDKLTWKSVGKSFKNTHKNIKNGVKNAGKGIKKSAKKIGKQATKLLKTSFKKAMNKLKALIKKGRTYKSKIMDLLAKWENYVKRLHPLYRKSTPPAICLKKSSGFNNDMAKRMLYYARNAYTLKNNRLLSNKVTYAKERQIRGVHVLKNVRMQTFGNSEVLIGYDEDIDGVVVSFAGTETANKEWITDGVVADGLFAMWPTRMGTNNPKCDKCRVHGGFYWRFVWQKCWIRSVVQQLLTKKGTKNLYVTGHSLGGAIATLAAPYLSAETSATKSSTYLYTFGSPRVGNAYFVEWFHKLVGNSYRIINGFDIVTNVPPTFLSFKKWNQFIAKTCKKKLPEQICKNISHKSHNYVHVGTAIYYPDGKQSLTVCPREDKIKEYGKSKYMVCCNRPLLFTKWKDWQVFADHAGKQYAKLFR